MILTYDDVQELTGMARVGVGQTARTHCSLLHNQQNSCIAVPCSGTGRRPSAVPRLLKHIPADRIPAEQQKCFKFNWGNLDKPTVEQLRDAYDQMGFGKGEGRVG